MGSCMILTLIAISSLSFSLLSLTLPASLSMELLGMMMICIIELVVASLFMDQEVCKSSPNDLMKLPLWIVIIASFQMAIVFMLVTHAFLWSNVIAVICRIGLMWIIALVSMSWFIIGVMMFFSNCFNLYDISGTFFMALSLLVGLFMIYRSMILINDVNSSSISRSSSGSDDDDRSRMERLV